MTSNAARKFKTVRYDVHGTEDGLAVVLAFKSRKAAINAADRIKDSEVYDRETKTYVHGSSKFMANLKANSK